MRILSKVLLAVGILLTVFAILSLWLRHEKSIEMKSVAKLLQSSPQWNRVHVRGAGGWRIVVDGVVTNEMQLKELRTELHRIDARKTAILVRVQE
jgi:hypothetical protein